MKRRIELQKICDGLTSVDNEIESEVVGIEEKGRLRMACEVARMLGMKGATERNYGRKWRLMKVTTGKSLIRYRLEEL